MGVRVDRDLCIGAGNCTRLVPSVFRLDDSETAVVTEPTAASIEQLRRAAKSCPAGAIEIDAEPDRRTSTG